MKLPVELPRFLLGEAGALLIGLSQNFAFFMVGDIHEQQESQRKIRLTLFGITTRQRQPIGALLQLLPRMSSKDFFESRAILFFKCIRHEQILR